MQSTRDIRRRNDDGEWLFSRRNICVKAVVLDPIVVEGWAGGSKIESIWYLVRFCVRHDCVSGATDDFRTGISSIGVFDRRGVRASEQLDPRAIFEQKNGL